MNMIYAKQQTYDNLKRVAEAVWQRWGIDVINFDDFIQICHKTGKRLGISLCQKTYRAHQDKIVNLIKNLHFEKSLESIDGWQDYQEADINDDIEGLTDDAYTLPTEIEMPADKDKVIAIKLMWASGSTQIFQLLSTTPATQQTTQQVAPQPQQPQYTGLFDYMLNGDIIIRRGTYTGVNVKSKDSILSKYGKMSWFYKWCVRKIKEADEEKIFITPDTPRDVETLKKIVKKIEKSMDC